MDGGYKNSGGVTARLYVDYNWNVSTGKLRMNKVYGSWTPSANMYYLTDRKVTAHNGGLWGMGLKKLSKTPTSNSFSYKTGWDYQSVATGGDGARAQSVAKVRISGMSGTSHTITVTVYVP